MTLQLWRAIIALCVVATASEVGAADRLSGTWKAVRALGGDISGPELVISGGEVTGTGGCNRFSGSAVIDGSALKFGPLRATKMFCAGKMDTETIFLSALDATRAFVASNNQLVFTDETGSPVAIFKK
ncbi:MAG: META domain-containing protein [Hyphomicrobium sp.]|nr:META domain-containing protein [Hyphomicrobium sp.]